jgi:multiple antibiotic resistance protein
MNWSELGRAAAFRPSCSSSIRCGGAHSPASRPTIPGSVWPSPGGRRWPPVTLTAFAVAGGVIFRAFGITLGAFKIAGGLMLFLMALDMMRAQPSRTRSSDEEREVVAAKDDVAIVPMAIPMLSGPGAIATVIVLMTRAGWRRRPRRPSVSIAATTCVLAGFGHRGGRTLLTCTTCIIEAWRFVPAAIAVEFMAGDRRPAAPPARLTGHAPAPSPR